MLGKNDFKKEKGSSQVHFNKEITMTAIRTSFLVPTTVINK
jgi:hypothetical protein